MRVSFETTDVDGPGVEGLLTVVTKWWVADVMCEAGSVDHVGVEPQAAGDLAANLRDLERVRQAVAGKVEPGRGAQHLGLS